MFCDTALTFLQVRSTWSNYFALKSPYHRKEAYLCRRLGRSVMEAEVDELRDEAKTITAAHILEQLDAGRMVRLCRAIHVLQRGLTRGRKYTPGA
jgi:hypothetical protein